jgi:acid phosphatase
MNAVGAVYANASLTLLNEGPSAGTIFFNFAHDTNITPILGLLGIFNPAQDLPVDYILFGNPWSTGNIVPQSGHFTIERLTCNATATSPAGVYVRLIVNEAVIPFTANQSGPGYSCPLDVYTSTVLKTLPDYVETCHVPAAYPQYLDFWWNFNTTTTLNYQNGSISCADSTTTV